MRVLLLSHYYPPELGAPQTRLRETVRGLVALGHQVRVVTGPPHYPDGRLPAGYVAHRPSREHIDGVAVERLPMLPRPNRSLLDRTVDQASFSAMALTARRAARWSEVLLVETPPLFLGASAAWLGFIARRPYLLHVADPWPDLPLALGALRDPVSPRLLHGLAALAYRRAALITTVSPGLVTLLAAKPSTGGRVRLLPNGVDTSRFLPGLDPSAARAALGWPEARLTLVYAGSVGIAQGVGTLVDAVAPLAAEGVVLHVLGQGHERAALETASAARGLAHVRFEPAVAAQDVPAILAAADAIAVVLRRGPLVGQSLPTKLVEGLAAGRPLIVSADGDAARLVAEHGAGLTAPAEDPPALRAAIGQLLEASPPTVGGGVGPRLRRMGAAGRALAVAEYERTAIVARLAGYLAEAAGSAGDSARRTRSSSS